MADAEIKISVKMDPERPLDILVKQSNEAEKAAGGLASTFGKVTAALAGLAALKGTFDFVLNSTREMEDLTTQFIAFTGSAENAKKQLQKLSDFAATSPFELAEVATANRTLLAFGSTTKQSIEQLRQLGEVSAATGTDLSELATIFGQIQAEGKLTGERFNQLVERGVNIGPELAKSLGVAGTSIRALISDGKITADAVGDAFKKMTAEGGQFFGATDRLSKTVSGSLSTMKDSFTALAATIGGQASPIFNDWVVLISDGVNALNEYIKAQDAIANGGPKAKRIEELKDQLEGLREKLADTEADIKRGISPIRLGIEKEETLREYKKLNDELVSLTDDRNKRIAAEEKKADDDEAKKIADKKADIAAGKKKEELAAIQAEQDKAAENELKKIQEKEAKITEIAFQEAAVRTQILAEQDGENDQVKLAALQEREAQLTSARLQIEADRLTQLKFYQEAELTTLQDNLNKKLAAEKNAEAKRKAEIQKAKADEFNFNKIATDQQQKFDEATALNKLKMTSSLLSDIAVLSRNKNRELAAIGKAAALFQIGVNIPDAAQRAYTSASIFGPVAGAAAAALAVAAGIQRLEEVRSQQLGFSEGGMVPGVGNKDTVPALLTPGEVVVPKNNFEDLQNGILGGANQDEINLQRQTNSLLEKILNEISFGRSVEKLTQVITVLQQMTGAIASIGSGFGAGGIGVDTIEPILVEIQQNKPQGGFNPATIGPGGSSRDFERLKAKQPVGM